MIGRAVVAHDTVDGDVAGDGGATIVPSTLLASLPSFFLFFLLFSSLLSRKRNSYRGKKRSKTVSAICGERGFLEKDWRVGK